MTILTKDNLTQDERETLKNGLAMLSTGFVLAASGSPAEYVEAEDQLIDAFVSGLSNNGFNLVRSE